MGNCGIHQALNGARVRALVTLHQVSHIMDGGTALTLSVKRISETSYVLNTLAIYKALIIIHTF